jgi:hypothetical protein
MKTKVTVDFNGSKSGILVSCKCDPEKDIFITVLAKRKNLWGYSTSFRLTHNQTFNTGPMWYRPTKFVVYEYIDGQAVVIDEIENQRYGKPANFYLLGGEDIATHFSWCTVIKEYSEKFNCKVNIESEYADSLSGSFPEMNFYTIIPDVALRSNYMGFNICRDLNQPNRTDIQTHKADIQYYNWWHSKPPHNMTDKDIARDIIFGPDLTDSFFDLKRSPEETIQSLFIIDEKLQK